MRGPWFTISGVGGRDYRLKTSRQQNHGATYVFRHTPRLLFCALKIANKANYLTRNSIHCYFMY